MVFAALESDGRVAEEPRAMLPTARVGLADNVRRSLGRATRTRTVTPSADSISSSRLGSVWMTTKPRRRTCGSLASIFSPPAWCWLRLPASIHFAAIVTARLISVNGKREKKLRSWYRFERDSTSAFVTLVTSASSDADGTSSRERACREARVSSRIDASQGVGEPDFSERGVVSCVSSLLAAQVTSGA
jgi:hypothetical protein